MAVGDRYRVTFTSRLPGVNGLFTCHYRVASIVGPGATDVEIAQRFGALIPTPLRAVMSNEASYLGVSVQRYHPTPPAVPAFSNTGSGVGSVVAPVLPPQTSGILTWRTLLAGRKYRGRSYIPFPAETSSTNNGRPAAPYVADLNTLATALLGPIVVTGFAGDSTLWLIVQHRTVPANFTDVQLGLARDYWATVRRRSRAGGEE